MKILISLMIVQINLVCGGEYSQNTCEVNKVGEKTWSPMTPLPRRLYGLRGLTMGSKVLMIGTIRLVHTVITSSLQYSGGYSGEIYSLDLNTEKWKLVDNLNVARQYHAVSSVELNLFDFCE